MAFRSTLVFACLAAVPAGAVTVAGHLEPLEVFSVRPGLAGVVMEVKADEGARVKAGDTLLVMDARPLAVQYEQDKARGLQTQAESRLAALQLARNTATADRLLRAGAGSEPAEDAVAKAKSRRARADSGAAAARVQLDRSQGLEWKANIVSLIDGWVLRRNVDAGSYAGMDPAAAPMLVMASDLGQLRLRAALNKAQARDLAPGQAVTFTVKSHPGMAFAGKVAEVAELPAPEGSAPVFSADLRVDNPGNVLWPGDEAVVVWGEDVGGVAKGADELDASRMAARPKAFTDKDAAVVIGIEQYQNVPASEYSRADAEQVKRHLLAMGMAERNIEMLLDEKAGYASVRTALESWLPNRVRKGGRAFVYYSGHGAPEPASGDAYLVPADGDPSYLTTTGYPLRTLYEKLGRLEADEVLVVLDSCFSGAGGRSVLARGVRPLVSVTAPLAVSSKLAVLSASTGAQISSSSPLKRHGVFTYHFLRALEDGKRDLADIFAQVAPAVEDEARALNVKQTPRLVPPPDESSGRFRF